MKPIDSDTQHEVSRIEIIKAASLGLCCPIAEELGEATEYFSEEASQLLKHHGVYQQDNRDLRKERKNAGLDKDYRFMVRTKFPGGHLTCQQYLLCDELATTYGQDDMRVTSRQGLQFHGVLKSHLRDIIHDLNRLQAISTLGGAGDVVRNVTASPVADIYPNFKDCGTNLLDMAKRISSHFLPRTSSYSDLWLDDRKATVHEDGRVMFNAEIPRLAVEEPLYGNTYLPRKFKIGIAADFDNSIDVLTNDFGIIAVTDNGRLTGYEVTVGGGLGSTPGQEATFPALGIPFAFVSEEDILPLLEAMVKIQRENGDRKNRRHARLKYLINDWGIEPFRQEVFAMAGRKFAPPRGVKFSAQPDYLGWSKQIQEGMNCVGLWIENGRIRDFEGGTLFKSGLRAIVERFTLEVRLTSHHNMILANIRDEDVEAVQAMLEEHNIPADKEISPLRRYEMACPAFPLCPLALSEAERVMPELIREVEAAGYGQDDVMIRMCGCANNCARAATAEIGLLGRGNGAYRLYIGGSVQGTRLAQLLLDNVDLRDVAHSIISLLALWKNDREGIERFGDWADRVGVEEIQGRLQAIV